MSEENAAFIRAIVDAYRNPELVARLARGELDLSWVDPEIEWDASRLDRMVPDLAGVYHGHDACEPTGVGGSRPGATSSSRSMTSALPARTRSS
jgi:hypothetical protein